MIEKDILDEEWREYEWAAEGIDVDDANHNYNTIVYRIDNPVKLFYREDGTTHRILDSEGVVHLFPAPGYFGCSVRWKPRNLDSPVAF